jgi:hypothetical protein
LHWIPINRGEVLRHPNIPKRLALCNAHLLDRVRPWAFTDSKLLHVGYDALSMATHCWQEVGKPPPPCPITIPFTFHFHAVVAYGTPSSLAFVPPSHAEGSNAHKSEVFFNSKHYINVIK